MGPRLLVLFLAAGLVVAVVPAFAGNQSVTATNFNFTPKIVTVGHGETVTWSNAGGYHNVNFEDGSFTEPPAPIAALWTRSRTFDTPGTFRYYCVAHQAIGMSGTVVVEAAAGTPGSPAGGPTPVSTGPNAVSPLSKPTSKAKCISRRKFRIRLREPHGERIRSANVTFNRKPLQVVKRRLLGRLRQTAEIDLRGLPKGTYSASIRAITTSGRILRGVRVYQTCAVKRTPQTLPAL